MDSIEAQGAQLLYLPPTRRTQPYRQAWSKFKQLLRAVKARAIATLELAMDVALGGPHAPGCLA